MSLDDEVRAELDALGAAHRLRVPRVVDGAPGPVITLDGVEVLNLSSNDYLSLAGDPRLVRAAQAALDEAGTGASGSRLITGTLRAHVALERALADWMQRPGVRLFNSGYAANLGVLTTLLRPGDVVLSDALNHASIIDGCRLSRAEIAVYPHGDVVALEDRLRALASRPGRKLVVTESLFSMDGDIVDLATIAALCRRYDAALVVDEAHAIGVHGPEGRGLAAAAGVEPDVVVGTFGKAFGSAGAFAVSSAAVADLLWNRARSLVFSTATPASIPAATLAALEVVRSAEGLERRRTLAENARQLRSLVPAAGGAPESAIAPILVGDDREVMRLSQQLLEERVFVQGIRPPTVPPGTARLRVSLSAGHTKAQLERAAGVLRALSRADAMDAVQS